MIGIRLLAPLERQAAFGGGSPHGPTGCLSSCVPAAEVRGDSEEMEVPWPLMHGPPRPGSDLPPPLTNSRDSPTEGPFVRHPRRGTSRG